MVENTCEKKIIAVKDSEWTKDVTQETFSDTNATKFVQQN